jgi:hypothetical protein
VVLVAHAAPFVGQNVADWRHVSGPCHRYHKELNSPELALV